MEYLSIKTTEESLLQTTMIVHIPSKKVELAKSLRYPAAGPDCDKEVKRQGNTKSSNKLEPMCRPARD